MLIGLQIVAGTECPARSANDENAGRVVAIEILDRDVKGSQVVGRNRIELFRTI